MKITPTRRIRVLRGGAARRPDPRSRGLLLAVVLAVAGIAVIPAFADGSGGVSVSVAVVPPAVKSVTVAPSSTSYGQCQGGSSTGSQLGFPVGECLGQDSVTITNGTAPATILVNGTDMVPADNGPHWKLCSAFAQALPCANQVQPGPDQYFETVSPNPGYNLTNDAVQEGPGPFLGLTPQAACDTQFNGGSGCNVGPSEQGTEFLAITGPESSSDSSNSFSTSVTWTAS